MFLYGGQHVEIMREPSHSSSCACGCGGRGENSVAHVMIHCRVDVKNCIACGDHEDLSSGRIWAGILIPGGAWDV